MSVAMLERILDKVSREAQLLGMQMYHYNEPLLLNHMPEMLRAAHRRKLPAFLSSNLVVGKNIPAVMAETPEIFLISVSGWTQSIYERSHAGGDIEKVKANMELLAQHRRKGTMVQVSWHRYRYNTQEEPIMQEFASKLGFRFTPYLTSLLPHDRVMRMWADGTDDKAGADLVIPFQSVRRACYDRRGWDCLLQNQILTVDGEGNYSTCSNFVSPENVRGNLFETTVPALMAARKTDSLCLACKAVGGHAYAQQSYRRSQWSPMRLAEVAYRRLRLQGVFKLTNFGARFSYLFARPQDKETL